MRIFLINPGKLDEQGRPLKFHKEMCFGLTLPYLAALIPERHEVSIIDDSVEEIDFDASVDAVMITAMTSRADRAYQIADRFRDKGKQVVMGGVHATFLPEEALGHADAVVAGEAEEVMEELIADLESRRLKGVYKSGGFPDLAGLPPPRYGLMNWENCLYPTYPVQVIRGCPNRCRYCTITRMMGARFRRRPIADVLKDLLTAGRFVFFVDDNLFSDRDYALELFKAMKGMGKIWGAQGNIRVVFDDQVIEAARAAGMIGLYFGIETVDREALRAMNKNVDLAVDPGEALDRFRSRGLTACASMMLGFDTDTRESGDLMIDFLEKHKVPFLFPYVLTPLPGTDYRRELEEAGRLLPVPWSMLDGSQVAFQPKNMTRLELQEMYWESLSRFYSSPSIIKRLTLPPRLVPIIVNYINRAKLRHHVHPWEGMTSRMGSPLIVPLIQRVVGSSFIRKAITRLERISS